VQLLTEPHYTIQYGDVGHTCDGIFGPYLQGAKAVIIEDEGD
jgi:ATP-dependent Lon protease